MKNRIFPFTVLSLVFLTCGFECIDSAMRDCPGFYYDYETNWREFDAMESIVFMDSTGATLTFHLDSSQITEPRKETQGVDSKEEVVCLLFATFFYTSPDLYGIFSISFHHQDIATESLEQHEVALYFQLHNEDANDYLYDYATLEIEPDLRFWAGGELRENMVIGGQTYTDVIELPFQFNGHSQSGQLQRVWAKKGVGILRLEDESGALYDRVF